MAEHLISHIKGIESSPHAHIWSHYFSNALYGFILPFKWIPLWHLPSPIWLIKIFAIKRRRLYYSTTRLVIPGSSGVRSSTRYQRNHICSKPSNLLQLTLLHVILHCMQLIKWPRRINKHLIYERLKIQSLWYCKKAIYALAIVSP